MKIAIIKRLLAAVMLMLFAFSVTPKKFLHDLMANHRDTPVSTANADSPQINIAGFNCHCDNLVAESPFTDDNTQVEIIVPFFFAEKQSTPVIASHSTAKFFFELRGPPARI